MKNNRHNPKLEHLPMSLFSFFSGLICVGFVIWLTYKLDQYAINKPPVTKVCASYKVTTIGQCTKATSNAWSGTDPGICRIELSNGVRVNMQAPVMLGDGYRLCE